MEQQQQQQQQKKRTRGQMRVGWRCFGTISIVIVLSYWNLFSFEVHLKMVRDVFTESHNHFYDDVQRQQQRANNNKNTMILHTNNITTAADDVPLSDDARRQQQQHKTISKESKAKLYSNSSKNKTIVFSDNDTIIQHKNVRNTSKTKFSDNGSSNNSSSSNNNTTDIPALGNLHDQQQQQQQQEEKHTKKVVIDTNKTKISYYDSNKTKTTLVSDMMISINSTTIIPVIDNKQKQQQQQKQPRRHEIVVSNNTNNKTNNIIISDDMDANKNDAIKKKITTNNSNTSGIPIILHIKQNHSNSGKIIANNNTSKAKISTNNITSNSKTKTKTTSFIDKDTVRNIIQNALDNSTTSSRIIESPNRISSNNNNNNNKTASKNNTTTTMIDWWNGALQSRNLSKSFGHQLKFHSKKERFLELLYDNKDKQQQQQSSSTTTTTIIAPVEGKFAAVPIAEDYAYLHIYKCGGTTIEKQTGNNARKVSHPIFRRKKNNMKIDVKWMTFVRDPIDHFFSGWSECLARQGGGYGSDRDFDEREMRIRTELGMNEENITRLMNMNMNLTAINTNTTARTNTTAGAINTTTTTINTTTTTFKDPITAAKWNPLLRRWLLETKLLMTKPEPMGLCHIHSFPQTNFLFKGRYDKPYMMPMTVIGDMDELKEVLNIIDGFRFNVDLPSGKNSSLINSQQRKIPSTTMLEWIDPDLLLELCEFLANDYYLFNFVPPEGCETIIV